MPTESNITKADEWFSGTDKVLQFTVVDSAGVAQSITGWALQWGLWRYPVTRAASGVTTALVSKTVGSGITITNGAGGICQVTVTDADIDGLEGGDSPLYYHELRRTDGGNEDILSYGTVVLRQSPSS